MQSGAGMFRAHAGGDSMQRLLERILERLEQADTRGSSLEAAMRSVEQAVERQGIMLDSGLRAVDTRCGALQESVDDSQRALLDAIEQVRQPPPPPPASIGDAIAPWLEHLFSEGIEERRRALVAAAAAAALALLLSRRRSRRALNTIARRVPASAVLLLQVASSAVLVASQAANAAHELPLLGSLVPRERFERPRLLAQGGLAVGAVILPWKMVLALIALHQTQPSARAAQLKGAGGISVF